MNEEKELLKIVKSYLYDKEYVADQKIDEKKMYELAKQNAVSAFLCDWAKKDCKSEEIKNAILQDFNIQIIRDTNENIEAKKMIDKLEENNIDTLMVKGIIMKEIYPKDYIRMMCDIDVLVHEKDLKKVKKILQELGYHLEEKSEKHITFVKKPMFIIEVHTKLVSELNESHEYFNNIWPNCVKYKDYEHIYKLDINDMYLFCIMHLLFHFRYEGNNIKDILDVYVLNEKYKNEFDYEKINKKFEEFGTLEFSETMKRIAYKWFGSEKIQEFDNIEEFIFKGQLIDNYYKYYVMKNHGKGQYFWWRFFPNLKEMKVKYPILEKAPVLLPFCWVTRLLRAAIFGKYTLKERLDKAKKIENTNEKEIGELQEVYEKLGVIRKEK